MTNPDAFALQHSDLNTFPFAEVGTECNGMTLTVVSVIARLGEILGKKPGDWLGCRRRQPQAIPRR